MATSSRLKTDSPVSRRIVRSFLDFLNSVEPASGVNVEGLDIVRECLIEAFKLESESSSDLRKPDISLIEIFQSLEGTKNGDVQSHHTNGTGATGVPSSSSAKKSVGISSEQSKSLGDDKTSTSSPLGPSKDEGVSKDELCGQFFDVLEKIQFFSSNEEKDEEKQLDAATRLFHEAVTDMERSGCQTYNRSNLADSLKSQGNKAMQSKRYKDAIELYSCAIGLCGNNAVYHCNRAAAFTQIHEYSKAINDCLKSIEIDPNYSKAYSRLGLAYYAQGNYRDAIYKGFKRALQLDPNNASVKENIRVAAQKYQEQLWHANGQYPGTADHTNQQAGSQSMGGSGQNANSPPFTSFPFNTSASFPGNFADMFVNMAASAPQGPNSQGVSNVNSGSGATDVYVGGNMNINLGGSVPRDGNANLGQGMHDNINVNFGGEMPGNFSVNLGDGIPGNFNVNPGDGMPGNYNVSLGDGIAGNFNMNVGDGTPGNININLGEGMPGDLPETLRSVMQMLSGAAPQPNSGDNANGRTAPS